MNTVEFYQQLRREFDLLAVHVCAEVEGEFVVACMDCQEVLSVSKADANRPGLGLSTGLCSDCHEAREKCCEDPHPPICCAQLTVWEEQ